MTYIYKQVCIYICIVKKLIKKDSSRGRGLNERDGDIYNIYIPFVVENRS